MERWVGWVEAERVICREVSGLGVGPECGSHPCKVLCKISDKHLLLCELWEEEYWEWRWTRSVFPKDDLGAPWITTFLKI